MEKTQIKTLVFSPAKGHPPYSCSCGTILKKKTQSYWLIKVENHPTETGHLRLASYNTDGVCPHCKGAIPLFCETEEEAQEFSDSLNERKLTNVGIIRLDGD